MNSTEYSRSCIEHADKTWIFGEGRDDLDGFHRAGNKVLLEVPSTWVIWNVSEVIIPNPPDVISPPYIKGLVEKYFSPDYIKSFNKTTYNHGLNLLSIIGLFDRIKKSNHVDYKIPLIIRDKGLMWLYMDNDYITLHYGLMGFIYKDVGGKIGNR